MNYKELKEKQQKEVNEFPLGFAFTNEQFNEMMEKWGLKPTDTDKIYSIGYGGYVRKADYQSYINLLKKHKQERQQAIKKDLTGDGYIYQMFAYELANHEYSYTGDITDTLEALGLTEQQVKNDIKLTNGLNKALQNYKINY